MSINLNYYLSKNKINLKSFCVQLSIDSYSNLIKYCEARGINCNIKEEDFNNSLKEAKKENVKKSVKGQDKPVKTRRRGRKPKAE